MGDSLCLPLLCAFSLTMHCSDFLAPLPSLRLNHPPLTPIAQQNARTYTNARQSWGKKMKRVFLHTQAKAKSPPLSVSSPCIDPPLQSSLSLYLALCSLRFTSPLFPLFFSCILLWSTFSFNSSFHLWRLKHRGWPFYLHFTFPCDSYSDLSH